MQLLGKEVTLFGLGCAMHKTHEILLHNKSLSLQLDQIKGGKVPWARLGSRTKSLTF